MIKHFTYHCEASREIFVITWVHQACESHVIVPCHSIHHNSKVVGGSIIIGIIPEHETLFSERILVFFIFNCCAIYLPKSIIALCKTMKSYNSSNWCCDVLGPLITTASVQMRDGHCFTGLVASKKNYLLLHQAIISTYLRRYKPHNNHTQTKPSRGGLG